MCKPNEIELRIDNELWGTISQRQEDTDKVQLHHKKLTDLDVQLCPGLAPYDTDGNILNTVLAPPFVHLTTSGLVKHKFKFQGNRQLVANVEDASADGNGKVHLVINLGLAGGLYLRP